jgi:hypothetical protein
MYFYSLRCGTAYLVGCVKGQASIEYQLLGTELDKGVM